jgi:hypothetical protein
MDSPEIVIQEMQGYGVGRFSTFFEKALVSLVNRRIDILIVRFWCRACPIDKLLAF